MTDKELSYWYQKHLGKPVGTCNGELDEEYIIDADGQPDWNSICIECKTYTMHRPHKPKIPDHVNDPSVFKHILESLRKQGFVLYSDPVTNGISSISLDITVFDKSLGRVAILALKAKEELKKELNNEWSRTHSL